MFTLTPIGSCRIAGPLRHGRAAHGIRVNKARVYGYCHAPAEAVQMARFLQGDLDIPADIWPLVSRSYHQSDLGAQVHRASDLYVVELASAKELTIDGVAVQLNYVRASYPEFFADPARAQQFWTLAESGTDAERATFLEDAWSATPEARAQSAILGRIDMSFVTEQSLKRDIETLSDLLGNVLFVSHVNAARPDGAVIGSRAAFIDMVAGAVTAAGHDFCNPTDLMAEFGQAATLEDDSTSLAHFTDGFSAALMGDWMGRSVAPRTTPTGLALPAQIAAACRARRFAEARARLPRDAQGLAAAITRRYDAACHSFVARIETPDVAAEPLLRDAAGLGMFEAALEFGLSLPEGLAGLSAYDLIEIAQAAATSGAPDAAFEFALAAQRKTPGLPRATALLVRLALAGEIDLLGSMNATLHAELLDAQDAATQLALLALNGQSAGAVLRPGLTAEDLVGYVSVLVAQGSHHAAAALIADWRDMAGAARLRDAGLLALFEEMLDEAVQIPSVTDRLPLLAALRAADPRHQGLRDGMRNARQDVVLQVRACGKADDLAALEALAPSVAQLSAPLAEYDLWRARLHFARGDFMRAIDCGLAAAAHIPEKISLWVLLMRAALRLENLMQARDFATRVVALACERTHKFKAEAERVLQLDPVGA